MASLRPTFENRQRALKIIGDVVAGWQKSGFRGRGSLDFVNNTRLIILLDILPPRRLATSATVFPKEIQEQRWGDDTRYYHLRPPTIEVFADLEKYMEVLPISPKPGFVWEPPTPISNGTIKLWLKLTAYIEAHQRESRVTWEHDVLPFLAGGQFESKRSRH